MKMCFHLFSFRAVRSKKIWKFTEIIKTISLLLISTGYNVNIQQNASQTAPVTTACYF